LGGATDYSQPFTNAGQVTTNPATTDSSIISVVVESTSLFQIKASYEQTGPTNYQTVGEAGANDAVTLEPVGFGTMTGMGVATLADAKATLTSVLEEMKGIGIQTGKLGANLTLIEEAYNLAGDRVAAGQVSLLRMSEEDFTDSSMEYAMKKIQADGNVALLSQAKEMSSKIYNLLW
jgi:flagellin-like hook-associated protein FlgL